MNILKRYSSYIGILFSTVALAGCNIDLVDPPPPVTVVHTEPMVVPDHYGPPAPAVVDHYGPPVAASHYGPPRGGHYGRPVPPVTVNSDGYGRNSGGGHYGP